jgi:hypothetical protein
MQSKNDAANLPRDSEDSDKAEGIENSAAQMYATWSLVLAGVVVAMMAL